MTDITKTRLGQVIHLLGGVTNLSYAERHAIAAAVLYMNGEFAAGAEGNEDLQMDFQVHFGTLATEGLNSLVNNISEVM